MYNSKGKWSLAVHFLDAGREIDRSNDIRLRASKTESVLGLIDTV